MLQSPADWLAPSTMPPEGEQELAAAVTKAQPEQRENRSSLEAALRREIEAAWEVERTQQEEKVASAWQAEQRQGAQRQAADSLLDAKELGRGPEIVAQRGEGSGQAAEAVFRHQGESGWEAQRARHQEGTAEAAQFRQIASIWDAPSPPRPEGGQVAQRRQAEPRWTAPRQVPVESHAQAIQRGPHPEHRAAERGQGEAMWETRRQRQPENLAAIDPAIVAVQSWREADARPFQQPAVSQDSGADGADADALVASLAKRDQATALAMLRRAHLPGINKTYHFQHTVLHRAIAQGLPDVALALLARGDFQAVNQQDAQGMTALHYAATLGHLPLCSAIVQHPNFIDLHHSDGQGRSALQCARARGHRAVVEFLEVLAVPARHAAAPSARSSHVGSQVCLATAPPAAPPSAKGQDQRKPPVDACVTAIEAHEQAEALRILGLKQVPGLNKSYRYKHSLLHRAIAERLPRVALAVLVREDFTCVNARDQSGQTALHFAAVLGDLPVCDALLRHPDFKEFYALDNHKRTALDWARDRGQQAVVALLEAAAPCYRTPPSPVQAPAQCGPRAVEQFHLDPSTLQQNSCIEAIEAGDEALSLELLQQERLPGLNGIYQNRETLLHRAIAAGLPRVALALVGRWDFQVNASDESLATGLHLAGAIGDLELCRAILARSDFVKLKATDVTGKSALDWACEGNHMEVVKLLAVAEGASKRA